VNKALESLICRAGVSHGRH